MKKHPGYHLKCRKDFDLCGHRDNCFLYFRPQKDSRVPGNPQLADVPKDRWVDGKCKYFWPIRSEEPIGDTQ